MASDAYNAYQGNLQYGPLTDMYKTKSGLYTCSLKAPRIEQYPTSQCSSGMDCLHRKEQKAAERKRISQADNLNARLLAIWRRQ